MIYPAPRHPSWRIQAQMDADMLCRGRQVRPRRIQLLLDAVLQLELGAAGQAVRILGVVWNTAKAPTNGHALLVAPQKTPLRQSVVSSCRCCSLDLVASSGTGPLSSEDYKPVGCGDAVSHCRQQFSSF